MSFNFKAEFTNKRNVDAIFKKNRMLGEDFRRGIRQAFYRFGKKTIEDISTDILRKPRTGRVYFINGRRHIASVAGEAPANLSGALRKSLDFVVHGYQKMELGYDDSVDYGLWLEEGTENIAARPGVKIGIIKNSKNGYYEKTGQQEIDKALKAKGR